MGKLEAKARGWIARQIHDGRFPVDSYLPTVEEMAAEAGCGPATMRQALNELARESVVKGSKRWGTRVLRTPPRGKVCFVLATDGDTNALYHRPLCEALMEGGYDVDILPWYLESRLVMEQLKRMLSGGSPADYLVALSPETLGAKAQARVMEWVPQFAKSIFICIDTPPAIADVEVVLVDQQAAARKVIGHLLELGHRRIGVMVNDSIDATHVYAQSARYCRDLCEVAGAELTAITHREVGSEEFVDWLRERKITALWEINDHAAGQTRAYLRGAGVDIPGEISLIGRNNPHPSGFLSTVSLNPEGTAKKVVEILRRRQEDEASAGKQHLIEPELLLRRSTGPTPA